MRIKLALCTPMMISLVLLVGCTGTRTSDRSLVLIEYPRLTELIEQARAEGEPGRLVIVDARSRERFDDGHIPGAVNRPLTRVTRHDDTLSNADHIVVYGHDWQDPRGPAVAKRLIELGYGQVYDFRGGLELWEARRAQASQ